MLSRIIFAVAVAVGVILACLLLGAVLILLKVEVATTVGEFLESKSGVIGVLAGLIAFAQGYRTRL